MSQPWRFGELALTLIEDETLKLPPNWISCTARRIRTSQLENIAYFMLCHCCQILFLNFLSISYKLLLLKLEVVSLVRQAIPNHPL